jgi:hypothetical protein
MAYSDKIDEARKTKYSYTPLNNTSFLERFRGRRYETLYIEVHDLVSASDKAAMIQWVLKFHEYEYAERIVMDKVCLFRRYRGSFENTHIVCGLELETIVLNKRGYQWPYLYTASGIVISNREQLINLELANLAALNENRYEAILCLRYYNMHIDMIKIIVSYVL